MHVSMMLTHFVPRGEKSRAVILFCVIWEHLGTIIQYKHQFHSWTGGVGGHTLNSM